MTIDDVQRETGINRSNVAKYERGDGETSLARYEQLADAVGLDGLAGLFARHLVSEEELEPIPDPPMAAGGES